MDMERIESPLLSTGNVASVLGVSRQHVVDLCDRGDLIFVRVGSHRRVPRSELDRLLGAAHEGRLTRDQERSLWLHRAVLVELVENPEDVLARVGGNLQRLRAQHLGRGMTAHWMDQWQKVLDSICWLTSNYGTSAEGAVVHDVAGCETALRARAPWVKDSRHGVVIIRECSGRVFTSQERCRGSGFGRRSGPHTVLSSGYGPFVGN